MPILAAESTMTSITRKVTHGELVLAMSCFIMLFLLGSAAIIFAINNLLGVDLPFNSITMGSASILLMIVTLCHDRVRPPKTDHS